MKDIFINIKNKTRKVSISNEILGIVGENRQGSIVIDFDGEFIDGTGWLEVQSGDSKGFIVLEKNGTNKTYSIPIKSSLLTTAGEIKLQIRVTQNKVVDETPIFKSEVFKLLVFESINAVEEIPDKYPEWIDIATAEINEMGNKIKTFDKEITEVKADVTELQEGKVDKEDGKSLSTNDFTNEYKKAVDDNTTARHSHLNKALLDTYDQTNANIKDAITKKHSHDNKEVLDGTTASYTTEEKTKLAGLNNYDDTEVKAEITALENGKVDKEAGKDLSTNDFTNEYKKAVDDNTTARHSHSNKNILDNTTASYTTEEKTKLSGIEAGAKKNVQSDWGQNDTTADDYIKNKPNIPSGNTLYNTTGQNTDGAMTQKAVTDELAKKQDKLIFDKNPTKNSNNPVTSDGIKTYTDTVVKNIKEITSKSKNGYIVFSDQTTSPILIQWGEVRSSNTREHNVTFPKAFTTLYTVVATYFNDQNDNTKEWNIRYEKTTGFSIKKNSNEGATSGCNWIAVGKE